MIKTPEEGFEIYIQKIAVYNKMVDEFTAEGEEENLSLLLQLQPLRTYLAGMVAALELTPEERREAGEKDV